ncbi:hypothetical protein MKX03_026386 [Papaver bracteatum]|nr:hypothetical protein MKX03_026386 [Papaver bracteatum]
MHPQLIKQSPSETQKISALAQRSFIVVKRHKPDKKVYTRVPAVRSKPSGDASNKFITNIDREDVDNSLAAVEYVDELYRFYKLAEGSSHVRDYMHMQSEIDASMRMELVDLLVATHHVLNLPPEALYLAVHIVDRYLSMNLVSRNEFLLVGFSALVIAGKYEDDFVPRVEEYVDLADGGFSKRQILAMENSILEKLGWTLTIPTAYHFLVRFIKAAVADKELENMVFYLAELGLMQYAMLRYSPSMLAASCVYAANCALKKTPFWNETLKNYTGFCESQLIECARQLESFHSEAAQHELQTVYEKYSSCEL